MAGASTQNRGELLGAELLHFEIASEFGGFADAAFGATGASTVLLPAQRVAATSLNAAAWATTALPAQGVAASGLTASGASVAALGATRVVPGAAAASGGCAASLSAQALASTTALAAGSSTSAAQTQALKGAVASGAGLSNVFVPAKVLANGVVILHGASEAALFGCLVLPSGLAAFGRAASDLGALGLVARIDVQDMERGAEFRSMDRGFVETSMVLSVGPRMEHESESRILEVTA